MGKPKMYGMNKTFIPNSKAERMNKRFQRKAIAKKVAQNNGK
jgi:hypothetical protein